MVGSEVCLSRQKVRYCPKALEQAGLDVDAAKFLDQEFSQPASVEALVREASAPATAVQVCTAARLAVVPDQPDEQRFLARLAEGLKL